MRVAFFGTPTFAVPTLQALMQAHEVVLVVAQPDRPAGRGQKMARPPTVEVAAGIPTLQPSRVKTGELPSVLEELRPDVAVVVAYGRILTPRLLAAPRLGCVNVHASILPRWRGAAPIQWAILAGDTETGVTTMRMAEGLDTGDVLLVERTPIGPRETAGELHDRLSVVGAELLVRTLAEWPSPRAQAGEVTLAPTLSREDGRIDWRLPAEVIERRVRGLSPWPGTFTSFRGDVLKILRASPVEGVGVPGTIGDGGVACGVGALRLDEVQMPGKRPVAGADWMNGARVLVGERLG